MYRFRQNIFSKFVTVDPRALHLLQRLWEGVNLATLERGTF